MDATIDQRGRLLRELRISVTDRCNFRCGYCMPKEIFGEGFRFLSANELLSFPEILRATRVFARAGVRKIRLTGGEPLLRPGLEQLIGLLADVDGISEIALTTNGAALAAKAQGLRDAGLDRVSVSLDALEDEVFARMNDVGFPVARVLAGIDAATAAGLSPVKVNMVVRRGINDHCVVQMAEHFRGRPEILRFIEYMDVGETNGWNASEVLTGAEIHRMIDERWPLEPLAPRYPGEVAKRYRYRDGEGQIGLITSISEPFCGGCTRARLSADGRLYTCLFATDGLDLRPTLRDGEDDERLAMLIGSAWRSRADRYSETRGRSSDPGRIEMSYIGG